MSELNKIKSLSELIRKNNGNIIISDNRLYLKVIDKDTNSFFKSESIETEDDGDQTWIKLTSWLNVSITLFPEIEKYFEPTYTDEQFVILSENGDFFYYASKDNLPELNDNCLPAFKEKCSNIVGYYKVYNRLAASDFSDHYNDANNEIIFYSSISGIIKVNYESEPKIDFGKNISTDIEMLLGICDQIVLKAFFIDALFTFSKSTGIVFLHDLILGANEVVSITKRNYELAAKKFDFEKFRNLLYKEKEKYFLSIREIINKISAQIISVPISISVAVFSTYKVADDKFMLVLVMMAFIIYSIFYIRLQIFYKGDLGELKLDFERDFQIIQSDSGLPENVIKIEQGKIHRKIESASSLISWLLIIVISLTLFVIIYILYELLMPEVPSANHKTLFFSFVLRFAF